MRETNHGLFALLERANDHNQAAAIFEDYMTVVFGLHPEQWRKSRLRAAVADREDGRIDCSRDRADEDRRRYRSSYVRLLRGWAYDSNSAEGAVLKGWVESRFGLFPTWHKRAIDRFSSDAWITYVEEKMGSRFHNNAIWSQLDLLYEFAQWSLLRDHPDESRFRLYRGVNDFDEHPLVERIDRRTVVVRLNNVVSFTRDRDVATWFGSYILEADVPAAKILFFNSLLPHHAVKGEGEVLAMGGEYRVRATYY